MGEDKALLQIHGKTMIEHIVEQLTPNFKEILIGADNLEKYSFLGHDIVADQETGQGPLMGILSCLLHSKSEINFITACDIPIININIVRRMLFEIHDYDVIVPALEKEYDGNTDEYGRTQTNTDRQTQKPLPDTDLLLQTGAFSIQPLFGVYRKSVIGPIKEILKSSEKRRVKELFDQVRTKFYKIDDFGWYKNINTIQQFKNFRSQIPD